MNQVQLPVSLRMRYMRHRTPRYIYNRTRLMFFELKHADDPWLTPEAVRILASMLLPSDRGVEFGSGRSTLWFAERINHLTSMEHDEQWYSTISEKIKSRGLTNVDYTFAPPDQPEEKGDLSEYARTALAFADESVNLALIDGFYREYTAKFMMPKIKPGGMLIIDNVNWFLPSLTRSPASRTTASGPKGKVWAEVAHGLAGWRAIWTSSGVWDTAIFVKP
jgi:hypothetical protein